jgi:LacI family transcriptional regulator
MPKIPKVILLIERSRAFGRGLLHGIVQYSNLHGPWLFYIEPEFYRKSREQSHEWIRGLDADGIIGYVWDVNFIKMIVNLGLPAIIYDDMEKPTLKVFRIVTDQVAIGSMAAKYLLECGFQHFAYCGFDDMVWSQQRGENFSRAVAASGFGTCFYQQPRAKHLRTTSNEQTIIAKWLSTLPKPLAVMACNDDRSEDVLAACKIAGLEVPRDVAILGVDNDELVCGLSCPQLSSIVLSTERAGYEAARVLDKLMRRQKIAKNEKEVSILPLHVVTRQSTDIMAIEDKYVAEAVSFIRRHSREVIQVGDVAQAVGLSRRSLEQHFRKTLDHSVLEEIKYNRINQMANILIGTNLSISRIAKLLGYPYASNIARYFKQQKGMSPSDYRRKFGPR